MTETRLTLKKASVVKSWLDFLYYELGKQRYDFYLCKLTKNAAGDIRATKWQTYSQVCFGLNHWETPDVNQRQILPFEIVLDLEEMWGLDPIIERLMKASNPFRVFLTGSRGYHIHIYFDEVGTEEEKMAFIKEFGGDTMKAYTKSLIALEFVSHWKSGKRKEMIFEHGFK